MNEKIRVAILDDHQSIIDGYLFRLKNAPDIEVSNTFTYGEEVEPALDINPVDVLLMDVEVPTSAANPNTFPILFLIPRLLQKNPNLSILVISMHNERAMVRAIIDAGASGYILKDDRTAIVQLPAIIHLIHGGGIYLSQRLSALLKPSADETDNPLTDRQTEILSYCAAYPEANTAQIAQHLNIAPSTVRNLLSGAYFKLDVPNKVAAIAKARQLGIIARN